MTAKTLNIAPLNAIFSRELGRFWPSWLYSFCLLAAPNESDFQNFMHDLS